MKYTVDLTKERDGEGHDDILALIAERRAAERRVVLMQWMGCALWCLLMCAAIYGLYWVGGLL